MERKSDFKYDLKLGQIAEEQIADILSNKKIEVKRDFKSHRTGNVFIEYECRGARSGISVTESDYYCLIISDHQFITISTEKLKELCRGYINTKRDVLGGDNNLSKGILLPLTDLLL